MITRLKWRTASISFVIVALVVTVLSALLLRLNINQLEASRDTVFLNIFQTLLSKIRFDTSINDRWLAEVEIENNCIIDISENEKPLFFSGAYIPKTNRTVLIDQAKAIAQQDFGLVYTGVFYQSLQPAEAEFDLKGEEDELYRAYVRMVQISERNLALLIVIVDSSLLQRQILDIKTIFFLSVSFTLLFLFIISVILAHLSVIPVKKSFLQQRDFIASASHELRSPLAVMKAGVGVTRLSGNTDKLIPTIEGEIERMSHLVDDLLLLAQSDESRRSIHKSTVDMEILLLEAIEMMTPLAEKSCRKIGVTLPDFHLPVIQADRFMLIQVMEILINNAFDHSQSNEDIEIRADVKKDQLCISVIDHGIGIIKSEQKRVFERFHRVDKSRTDRSHSGLGLSIAQEYVLAHRGNIYIIDTAGGGTTVTFEIPLTKRRLRDSVD